MIRVGILGGGQLGRMLALAGYPLDIRCRVFDNVPDACAGQVAELVVGEYDDHAALDRFAENLDVVTIEWENVPVEAVRYLATKVPVYPNAGAIETAQDRFLEKSLFRKLGIETAPFAAVGSLDGLREAMTVIGLPAILKTRRLGYDGKGQYVLRTADDAEFAWAAVGGVPSILEGFVQFERELSVIAARSCREGETATAVYPLTENVHRGGILRTSRAPAPRLSSAIEAAAHDFVSRVGEALDFQGVFAVELFEIDGRLLANEMAPRVHNSGHWTIEGAVTSQFENHLRAVCDLPLGSASGRGEVAMLNLIGSAPPVEEMLAFPGAAVHLYGKSSRPGRKIGHLTVVEVAESRLEDRLAAAVALVNRYA